MDKDIKKLEKFLTLSDPMLLTPNETIINFENTIVAKIATPNIPQELGIWSMGQLLKLVDLIQDAEIEIDNNLLIIKNDKIKQKYELTSKDFLESFTTNKAIFERVKNAKLVGKITLTKEDLNYIKKVAGILQHKDVVISDKLIITTITGNDTFQNPNEKEISIQKELENSYVFDFNNLSKIPLSDYEVEFHKSDKGVVVSLFKDIEEDIEIIVAINKTLN